MTRPDTFDDTSHDHERFEEELVARDQEAARVSTGDIDEASARDLVRNLIAQGVVSPVETERLLVHEPSETAFESMRQLGVFHRGWTAAHETDKEES